MIAGHARLARRPRRASSACPPRCSDALGRLVRALGRQGLPRRARRARDIPVASPHRPARRVRRGRPPHRRHRRRRRRWPSGAPASSSIPISWSLFTRRRREGVPRHRRARIVGRGARRRAVAGGRRCPRPSATRRWPRSPASSTSSRRTRSATPQAVADLAAGARHAARACPPTKSHVLHRAGLVSRLRAARRVERHLGQAGAASPPASGSGSGCTRTSPSGCCTSPKRSRRSAGSPCSTASGSTGRGYPRGLTGTADHPPRPDPRRRRRLPGDARAPPAPRRTDRRPTRPPSCAARCAPVGWTAPRSTPCSPPPATASAGGATARPGSPPARSRCCACSRSGLSNKQIAARLVDHPEDRGQPHRAHLHEDRRHQPRRGQPLRHATRPAPRPHHHPLTSRSVTPEAGDVGSVPASTSIPVLRQCRCRGARARRVSRPPESEGRTRSGCPCARCLEGAEPVGGAPGRSWTGRREPGR